MDQAAATPCKKGRPLADVIRACCFLYKIRSRYLFFYHIQFFGRVSQKRKSMFLYKGKDSFLICLSVNTCKCKDL